MKRSEINQTINKTLQFFDDNRFFLPVWATWAPEEWKSKGDEYAEIRNNGLGWDITDFGKDCFSKEGLALFTVRNGNLTDGKKTYCEKIMMVQDSQLTPYHFHWQKTEDIINRGGGTLCIQLLQAGSNEETTGDMITVQVDGVTTMVNPAEIIRLKTGQSITLVPYVYHAFWAEGGDCMVGEVSTVNDDKKDNRFLESLGRFPSIVEDVPAGFVLGNGY